MKTKALSFLIISLCTYSAIQAQTKSFSGYDNNGIRATLSITSGPQEMLIDGNEIDAVNTALYLNGNSGHSVLIAEGGGNVGIGTSPASRLHIRQLTNGFNGGIKIENSGNDRQFNLFVDDSDNSRIESAGDGTGTLILNSGHGNVGIGTTDPQKLFEVNTGGAMWDDAIVRIKGMLNPTLDIYSESNWHPRLRLLTNNGADAWEMHAAGSQNNRNLVFAYNGSKFFNITKNGDVGIGTNNPEARLHVLGTGYFSDNVGIGTSSPASRLHVKQLTNDFNGGLKIMNSANNRQFNLFVDDTSRSRIESASDGSGELILNSGGGKVGIGTTSPAEKLEVVGTVKATSFVSSAASFPDYVFAPGYKITPLSELETYVTTHKHLPNMPSEKEVVDKGLNLPGVVVKSVENIETIYLHLIRMEKEIKTLQQENAALKQKLEEGR